MYTTRTLDSYYFRTKVLNILFIPIRAPYRRIYSMATDSGEKLKDDFGLIVEQGKLFGFGWIGVEINKPEKLLHEVVHISGSFEVHEHVGPYHTIGKAYRKIKRDRPFAKELYNFYLDDPHQTLPEKCRTQILFR